MADIATTVSLLARLNQLLSDTPHDELLVVVGAFATGTIRLRFGTAAPLILRQLAGGIVERAAQYEEADQLRPAREPS